MKKIRELTYSVALRYAQKGDVKGAWEVLASDGDNYAYAAAKITSTGEGSKTLTNTIVRKTWVTCSIASSPIRGRISFLKTLSGIFGCLSLLVQSFSQSSARLFTVLKLPISALARSAKGSIFCLQSFFIWSAWA